jgi:predicted RNA-binding protein associated with RNAse of E/G family
MSPPGDPAPTVVRIHYLRPPSDETVYEQLLLHDDGRTKVTFARNLAMDRPLRLGGGIALEGGSDAVWFTFPGAWHDIGRFHLADGTFTGIYANMITPCLFEPGGVWRTTDLFVDLWIPAENGEPRPRDARLVDLGELEEARAAGRLPAELAEKAEAEGKRLMAALHQGTWPPSVVREWTRERALDRLGGRVGPEGFSP